MSIKPIIGTVALLALLACAAGAAWTVAHGWEPGTPPSSGDGVLPEPQDRESVVCIGYVDLERGLRMLAPLRPGRVTEVLVSDGDAVQAGMPLARLDDRDARLLVKEAEQAVDSAKAQRDEALRLPAQHQARVKQQQAAIEAAGYLIAASREQLARQEALAGEKLNGSREVAIAQNQLKELQARERVEREKLTELEKHEPTPTIRKAESELKLAETRVEQARRQLEECTLVAPMAGVVHRVLVGKGDVLAGLPAIQLCPNEPRLIRAEVEQEFAYRVAAGQLALVKDDARPGQAWRGKVMRVADWYAMRRPQPQDPSAFSDVRTVECLIAIDPDQEPLRIGQRMRVLIGPAAAGKAF